jgi:hypothetical protein
LFNLRWQDRRFDDLVHAFNDGVTIALHNGAAALAVGDLFAHDFTFADEVAGEAGGAGDLGDGLEAQDAAAAEFAQAG